MKLNQKGFGAVEGLLVVIALTLIVGVGFYVVNANKDNKQENKTAEATTTESKSEATKVNEKETPDYVGSRMAKIYEATREAVKENQDIEANYLLKISDKGYFSENFINKLKAPFQPYEGLRFGCGNGQQPDRIEALDTKIENGTATVKTKGYVNETQESFEFANYQLVQLNGDWAVDGRTCIY